MLRLIESNRSHSKLSLQPREYGPETEQDHHRILEQYFQSFRTRNFSPHTQSRHKRVIQGWLTLHGTSSRPLLIWEAMQPYVGRKRIQEYSSSLLATGISIDTLRCYLSSLKQLFSYVLEHPYLIDSNNEVRLLQELYGPFEHPITEYDIPNHSYDGEPKGIPLPPEKLYDFYSCIQNNYLNKKSGHQKIRARNYSMIVLAGESGLRLEELMHLELDRDLFFDSKKLQTRFGKASNGSGKRSRMSLFPPLARDTLTHYLKSHPRIPDPSQGRIWLFPSKTGKILTHAAAHAALQEVIQTCQRAGFQIQNHFSWHWLRRLFATRFIEQFPDKLPTLINLLGHVSPNTVHRYIRHSQAWLDEQIQSVMEGSEKWPYDGNSNLS
ncbi:MAG: site-specific integrase [Bdellovibrionia bacterium]